MSKRTNSYVCQSLDNIPLSVGDSAYDVYDTQVRKLKILSIDRDNDFCVTAEDSNGKMVDYSWPYCIFVHYESAQKEVERQLRQKVSELSGKLHKQQELHCAPKRKYVGVSIEGNSIFVGDTVYMVRDHIDTYTVLDTYDDYGITYLKIKNDEGAISYPSPTFGVFNTIQEATKQLKSRLISDIKLLKRKIDEKQKMLTDME